MMPSSPVTITTGESFPTRFNTVIVCFYYPTDWVGWLVSLYQRACGVKFYNLVHVKVKTMTATYERGLGFTVMHAVDDTHLLSHAMILVIDKTDSQIHTLMHRYFLAEGDMGISDIISGSNCTDIVHEILGTVYNFKSTLPGDLFYEMSCFISDNSRISYDGSDPSTGSYSPPDSYSTDKRPHN